MDKVKKGQMADYIKESQSWETSAVLTARKIARVSMIIAACGLGFGLLGGSAAWMQYKRPPPAPFVIWGDKALGRVDQVQSLAEAKITVPEATDKYFAQLYVQYRESWDPEMARKYDQAKTDDERSMGNFYRVILMSTDAESRRYQDWYASDQGPAKRYGDNAKATVRLEGTTFLRPGVALVRYALVVERRGRPMPEITHHSATVTVSYSNAPMKERDRAINLLNFQADYRTDPDIGDPMLTATATPINAPAVPPQPAPAPAAPVTAPLDLRPLQARGE